jgi:hypothetical protein
MKQMHANQMVARSPWVKVFVIVDVTNLMDMVENTNFHVCKSKSLALEIDVSNALDGALTSKGHNSSKTKLDWKNLQVDTQLFQLVGTLDGKTLLDKPMKVPNNVNCECVVALTMLLCMIFS